MRVAFATAIFALVHSALASRRAKSAARAIPPRVYRVLYNAQGLLTFGALVWYISRQPKRTLYHLSGMPAAAMRLGQLGGVLFAIAAARATGIAALAGLDPDVEPAAQGPEGERGAALRIRGPFRIVRHPLNLAPVAPFWLTPHMTSRRLAFNIIATAYLVAGSYHEETRLLARYGDAYEQYRRSGVPLYVPRLRRALVPWEGSDPIDGTQRADGGKRFTESTLTI